MPFSLVSHPLQNCSKCDLRSQRMFCNLNAEALADYVLMASESTFPSGTALFEENTLSRSVLIICTGQVKLSCSSKEGRTLILKIAMPGHVLG